MPWPGLRGLFRAQALESVFTREDEPSIPQAGVDVLVARIPRDVAKGFPTVRAPWWKMREDRAAMQGHDENQGERGPFGGEPVARSTPDNIGSRIRRGPHDHDTRMRHAYAHGQKTKGCGHFLGMFWRASDLSLAVTGFASFVIRGLLHARRQLLPIAKVKKPCVLQK